MWSSVSAWMLYFYRILDLKTLNSVLDSQKRCVYEKIINKWSTLSFCVSMNVVQMVTRFDLPSSGCGLYESDYVVAVSAEPSLLPTGLSVFNFRDRLLAASHRFGRQSIDHRLERHAAHARWRWYRHRLARQLARHVSLASRWRRRRTDKGTHTHTRAHTQKLESSKARGVYSTIFFVSSSNVNRIWTTKTAPSFFFDTTFNSILLYQFIDFSYLLFSCLLKNARDPLFDYYLCGCHFDFSQYQMILVWASYRHVKSPISWWWPLMGSVGWLIGLQSGGLVLLDSLRSGKITLDPMTSWLIASGIRYTTTGWVNDAIDIQWRV